MKRKIMALTVTGILLVALTGCSSLADTDKTNNEILRTVSVSGVGKVSVAPDRATFNIQVSETKDTTAEALSAANEKMASLLKTLKSFDIPDTDLTTQSITLRPDYDWIDSKQVLRGQKATQNITVKVKGVDKEPEKLGNIIDQLSTETNITLSNISFDKADKTEAEAEARVLSVADAKDKAASYAASTGMSLGYPLSIGSSSSSYTPLYNTISKPMLMAKSESVMMDSAPTEVPSGELDISSSIQIVYQLMPMEK